MDVFFDDLTINHTESPIVQEDHYYPYGLTMRGIGKDGSNPWKYNGKEEQDELGLGWMDYGARMYDAALGRWHVVDPLPKPHESLYSAFVNNPIRFMDPTGKDTVEVLKATRELKNHVKTKGNDVFFIVNKKGKRLKIGPEYSWYSKRSK